MRNENLYDMLVDYIENNKTNYSIDYEETIESLKELIEEIEEEYTSVEVKKIGKIGTETLFETSNGIVFD